MSSEGFSPNPRTPSQEALEEAVKRFAGLRAANSSEDKEDSGENETEETAEERAERILAEAEKAAQKADKAYGHRPPFWIEKDN